MQPVSVYSKVAGNEVNNKCQLFPYMSTTNNWNLKVKTQHLYPNPKNEISRHLIKDLKTYIGKTYKTLGERNKEKYSMAMNGKTQCQDERSQLDL